MIFLYGTIFVCMIGIGLYVILFDKKNGLKIPFYQKIGLFLYERTHKLWIAFDVGQEQKEQEKYRAVYIGEDSVLHRKLEEAKMWGYIWLAVIAISVIGIGICLTTTNTSLVDGNKLERPSFGMGETEYDVTVSGIGDEAERVTITVGEQQPEEEQMNEVFEATLEEVKQEVLGENISLEEVRSDLNFFTMTEKGIRLSWESGDEMVLTSFGEIVAEDNLGEIPEEGIIVSVTVYMTYATYEAWYEFYVRILPPMKDIAYYKRELQNLLQASVGDALHSQYATLPTTLQQFELTYSMKEDDTPMYVGLLGVVVIFLLASLSGKKIEQQYEIRRKQMEDDYSQIVSQISILISCGMNIRSAWARIVSDYEKRKVENGTLRYAYEEMKVTNYELERGYPESRAYGSFGRRCGIYSYVKLGNLLEQGIRQGVSGLEKALNQEVLEALENKIHEAKRKGEQTETKMLIPMFLMLGIVMAVLMVPAFLSF